MKNSNKLKRLSTSQFHTCSRARPLAIAGFGCLLLSLTLLGESSIQFLSTASLVTEGAGPAAANVRRANDLDTVVTVDYATSDDTAIAGKDYVATSGTITFAAGQTNQIISVPILNDGLVQGTRQCLITLSNPGAGAVLGSRILSRIRISDDDTGPYFAATTYQVTEDGGSVRLRVDRGNDGDQPITVDYVTVDGTALAGVDYEAASGTVEMGGDDLFQEIAVVIKNDGVNGPNKTFQVQLTGSSVGAIGSPALATVTIVDSTPEIFSQPSPADQSVSLGAPVSIRVFAKGALMRWQKRNHEGEFTDLPGATSQVLEWNSATVDLSGAYRFIVSSSTGESVLSEIATLMVDPTFVRIDDGPGGTMPGGTCGAAWADYDGNGYPDLFIANVLEGSSCLNVFWHNNGDGTFSQITGSHPVLDSGGYWYAYWTDYDNDGDPDLHVLAAVSDPDRFYRNDGNGVFTPVTPAFVTPTSYGEACSWADFDNDGWLDVFIPRRNGNDLFFSGGSGAAFSSMTALEAGEIVEASTYAVGASFDYDGDGARDLLVAPLSLSGATSYCRLYHNEGASYFRRITEGDLANQPSEYSGATFVCYAAGDYDHDGDFDLMVTAGEDGYRGRLYRNDGNGTFTNVAAAAGVDTPLNGYLPSWADFDNDGDLDLLIMGANYWNPSHVLGNGNVLFRNNGDGTFTSIEVGSPLHDGVRRCSLGWVDYDNDGFLDLFMANGNAIAERNFLYRNNLATVENPNHWLKVRLTGRASNSMGVGATIRATATIGGKSVRQLQGINTPGSMTSEDFVAHFGLGDATQVETLRIEWPSGIVQELTGVAANQLLEVTETQDASLPEPLAIGTFGKATDGVFHATVDCPIAGLLCVLESSSDLERWSKVQVRTNETGVVEFTDTHTVNSPTRFYRVAVP